METRYICSGSSSSNSKKSREEVMYWNLFQTLSFAIRLSPNFISQLIIPQKFSENVRTKLPVKVSLRGPSADGSSDLSSWEVQLCTNNNTTSIVGEGWKEFVIAYSLKENDILFFNYEYNSYFKVSVYDAQSCWVEKESSYFVKKSDATIADNCEKEQEKMANSRQETSIQVLTDSNKDSGQDPSSGDSREKVFQYMSREGAEDADTEIETITSTKRKNDDAIRPPAKKSREEENELRDNNSEDECGESRTCFESVRRALSREVHKTRRGAFSPSKYANGARKREPTREQIERIKQANQELNEEGFFIVMARSHVSKNFRMALPRPWTSKFMPRCNQDVILQLNEQEDKEWRVRYNFHKPTCTGKFIGGWNHFARDNALHESDVCLFKLAGRKEGIVCLDVKLIRVVEEESFDVSLYELNK